MPRTINNPAARALWNSAACMSMTGLVATLASHNTLWKAAPATLSQGLCVYTAMIGLSGLRLASTPVMHRAVPGPAIGLAILTIFPVTILAAASLWLKLPYLPFITILSILAYGWSRCESLQAEQSSALSQT